MYYKLPVKERIELMKSYKKANPDMSYQDMVNDYNTSYQRFDNGGKKEREPIYVTDKNDPRIRAYKDSLDTYNFNKSALNQLYKTGKTPKGTSVDLTTKRYITRDQGINEDYVDYKKFLPNITKKDVVGEWDYVDNYKGKLNRSTSAYKFKFKDSDGDFTLKQYQKPVQPVIYKKLEEKKEPEIVYQEPTKQTEPTKKEVIAKKVEPVKTDDGLTRSWNFSGPNPALHYYDKSGKIVKKEYYTNAGPNGKKIEPIRQ